uniref:phospholipase A2 n=1 Tax=Oryzias sinensis TaxID=183150 RepID=A0A8C8DX91_9TELE
MVDNRYLLRATFFFSCLILSKSQNASDAGLLCLRSAAADGQTSVTFMRQWSSGARAVYLTRWSQDTTLLGCDIYSDPSVVESYSAQCKIQQQPQDQDVFTRFDVHAVLAPNAPCVLVPQKFSAPTRGDGTVRKTRRKRSWLFPGTLWCGSGSRARGYDQLGMFERADVCCREHDHCQHSIPALSVSYGVFNHHFFTVSHCNCDQRFRQCLKRMNDSVSSMIGYTFFSVLQVPCFDKEQHLTKIKRVDSERKSSKAKPRCEPRDPPRGDTFHRRSKTGKRCRTQKNLEEVSSLLESTDHRAPTRSMPQKNGPSKKKTQGLKKESRAMKKSRRKDLNEKEQNIGKKITLLSFFFFPENHLKCESLKHLDDCKFKISPLQGKYNLHNKDFKTVYHCDCTSRLAAQIKSFEQPSYLSSVLADFVSHQCFTLPKQNKCPHEKRYSGLTHLFIGNRFMKC